MASKYDRIKLQNVIPISQGSDYYDTVVIKTPDPAFPTDRTKDRLLDLTGCLIRSKLSDLDGNIKATFVVDVVGPGTLGRHIPKSITSQLMPAVFVNHVWGLEITAADGTVIPEISGGAMVNQEVVL